MKVSRLTETSVLQINENQPAHGNIGSNTKLVLQSNEIQPAHGNIGSNSKLVLQINEKAAG